jgi:undecaprenyl-diphosphatase
MGFTRESIARFSFLMSTPIIFGAGLVKMPKMIHEIRHHETNVSALALVAAMIAAAVVGTLVIRWLLNYLRTRSYAVFAIYRLLVAAGIVVLWFAGKR